MLWAAAGRRASSQEEMWSLAWPAAPVVPRAGPAAGWGTMQAVLHIPYMPHLHICEGGRPSAPHLPFWVCHYHSTKTFGIPAMGPTSRLVIGEKGG